MFLLGNLLRLLLQLLDRLVSSLLIGRDLFAIRQKKSASGCIVMIVLPLSHSLSIFHSVEEIKTWGRKRNVRLIRCRKQALPPSDSCHS